MILSPTVLTDLYAPVRDELERTERLFHRELASKHPFVNDLCDRVSLYRGKMLRPALVLLCGKAFGHTGDVHETLAAVVEMVHIATLVHDDVLDQAHIRRQHATINATNGNETAVRPMSSWEAVTMSSSRRMRTLSSWTPQMSTLPIP